MMFGGQVLKFNDLNFNQLVAGEFKVKMKREIKQKEKDTSVALWLYIIVVILTKHQFSVGCVM